MLDGLVSTHWIALSCNDLDQLQIFALMKHSLLLIKAILPLSD